MIVKQLADMLNETIKPEIIGTNNSKLITLTKE